MVTMGLTGCRGYAASSQVSFLGIYVPAMPAGRSTKLGQGKSAALQGNLGIDSLASLARISVGHQMARGPAIGSCTNMGRLGTGYIILIYVANDKWLITIWGFST